MASGSQNMTTYLAKGFSSVLTTNASNSNNLLYINTTDTNITADMLGATTSIAFTRMSTTGAYTTGHMVWLNAANIGTPFQLVVHDSSDLYFYKRYKSSGAWTTWSKMNAGHADLLTTARTINGTNFDGSANIITANWGTARTLTIGNTGKSVNGSANISWSMNELMGSSDSSKFYRGDKSWNNTLTGPLYIGTNTNRFTVHPNGLCYKGTSYDFCILRVIDGGSGWGHRLVIGAAGGLGESGNGGQQVVIGAGESAGSYVDTVDANDESLHLLADSTIFLQAGADTIANRKGFAITSASEIIPVQADTYKNGAGTLGTNGYRWGHVYTDYLHSTNYIYAGSYVQAAAHMYIDTGHLNMKYNNTWYQPIRNHGNGNISVEAASNGLYIGYSNTKLVCVTGNQKNSKNAQQSILHIYGTTYGNDSAYLLSGTAGLFSWGDGGPQITFDTSSNPGGGQAGALIFTDHDSAATGVSWHFVSNQGDWNVTSKRFHARTSISIGTNLPNTSYNFYLNGSGYLNSGYFYIGPGGGVLNGAATNGGINSIRVGDDVWLGDCNAGGIMGMKSTGANTGFYFYNSSSTNTGQLYADGTYIVINKGLRITSTTGIYYTGSKATYRMIRFIDNTSDTYGNGISIGGGGQTIIGGGESSDTAAGQAGTGGSEIMWICNDGAIEFYPNLQNGWTTSYKNYIGTNGHFYSVAVHSAVWNDLGEMRKSNVDEPGRVIEPSGNFTTSRLSAGCRIVSDTYGFLLGETENKENQSPVAIAGRVLAYTYRDKSEYKIGDAVCSAPGGTIDIMTREEIMMYPDRIIGIVNEIPDYDIWEPSLTGGREPVHTNGRIWIDVR